MPLYHSAAEARAALDAAAPHRMQCEARELLRWPLEQRRAYLDDLPKYRGQAATDALKAAILAEWRKQRSDQGD